MNTLKERNWGLYLLLAMVFSLVQACDTGELPDNVPKNPQDTSNVAVDFRLGADFSYINEMRDCGGTYKNQQGLVQDPFEIFAEAGCGWARFRLWHNPDWTNYSNLADVRSSIKSAKDLGMKVLLDFHYSDDWADPGNQLVPKAWEAVVNDLQLLGDSVYNYTLWTLTHLHQAQLLPELVQLGNEINSEILQDPNGTYNRINWSRNAHLLNKAVDAVNDFESQTGEEIEIMFHVAQPEHAIWWMEEARDAGLDDYEWMGISYYPIWSSYALEELSEVLDDLGTRYGKKMLIVETAYPFTLEDQDNAGNILGEGALIDGFPASQTGQLEFLKALKEEIVEGGGLGLFYWEPAWISTPCSTRWGDGSHWDNAVFFDKEGQPNEAMGIFGE